MADRVSPDRAAELLALSGFTEGPIIVQGFDIAAHRDGDHLVLGCVNRSYGARSHEYSLQLRSDPAVAANARLWAAAPDLHALAQQQAAEIERLRGEVCRLQQEAAEDK